VRKAARPGTKVFIMDLMRPASATLVDDFVERYCGNEPAILKHDFGASLRAAFTVDEVREQLRVAGLALDVEAVSDRHLIVHGVL
jgi:hypothetical protein